MSILIDVECQMAIVFPLQFKWYKLKEDILKNVHLNVSKALNLPFKTFF